MARAAAVLAFIGLTVVSVWFLWASSAPLGVEGEWTWERITVSAPQRAEALMGMGIAAFVFAAYAAFVWWGARRLAGESRRFTSVWLCGLVVSGFAWLWVVQDAPRANYGLSKTAWVPYFPSVSGYFHEAHNKIDSPAEYLRGYEQRIQTDDPRERVLHVGTHPPGLFLLHDGLIEICRRSPALVSFLEHTQPTHIKRSFDDIAAHAIGKRLDAADRMALWLGVLLTQLIAVGTVVPLFHLLRGVTSQETAWTVSAMWPLLPAVAIFLPKSDALYPCLATWFMAVWLSACRRQSVWRAFVAGALFFAGLLLSLAFLPAAALAAWLTFHTSATVERPRGRTVLVAFAAVGFALPCVGMWLQFDLSMPQVWWLNYQNHADFYEQYTRTWSAWLGANVLEGVLAVGTPVALLAVVGLARCMKGRRHTSLVVGVAAVWGGLWLSGKNMGESARLWLIFDPWILWLAAAGWHEEEETLTHRRWLFAVLILQGLVCIATVTRVSGFPLGLPIVR